MHSSDLVIFCEWGNNDDDCNNNNSYNYDDHSGGVIRLNNSETIFRCKYKRNETNKIIIIIICATLYCIWSCKTSNSIYLLIYWAHYNKHTLTLALAHTHKHSLKRHTHDVDSVMCIKIGREKKRECERNQNSSRKNGKWNRIGIELRIVLTNGRKKE